jgi:hypothetical protein
MTFYEVKGHSTPRPDISAPLHHSINFHGESVMVPSATGYLFLLALGCLSLAATVAVAVSAYRHRHGRRSEQPRAWH